jgi:hypothetical protein
MDSEAVALKPARPDSYTAILHAGLVRRRAELRKDWQRILPADCLKQLGPTAAKVTALLSGPEAFRDWRTVTAGQWTACDASLSECLMSIGLGEKIACHLSAAQPTAFGRANLKKLSGVDRVEALCVRYRCPLNIGVESEAAEELLRQLMVTDRARLEAEAAFEVDDVLLKLNLAAVYARMRLDLRFLDALNYYYELPQRSLGRLRRNPHFLAAWLCIYAQLLCAPDW